MSQSLELNDQQKNNAETQKEDAKRMFVVPVQSDAKFATNEVTTSKYTMISFVPK